MPFFFFYIEIQINATALHVQRQSLKTTNSRFLFPPNSSSCWQEGEKVAKMMGVDGPQLYMNLLKPKIKVGNEFVTQGRNVNQVNAT